VRFAAPIGALMLLLPVGAGAWPLANPSAELPDPVTPEQPLGWRAIGWGGFEATFAWFDGGPDGQKALRVEGVATGGEGDGKWISDPTTVPQGNLTLKLGHAYRSDVETAVLVWTSDGAAVEAYIEVATLPASLSWTQREDTVVLPDYAKQFSVMHVIRQTGFLETDAWTVTQVAPPKKYKSIVSLTFDDGWTSAYQHLIPLMESRGLRGTHFLISGYIDTPGYAGDYIGGARITQLLEKGHEIASHTILHEDMSQVTTAYLTENLELSKLRLEKTGAKVVGFAWPLGKYTEEGKKLAAQRYLYVETVLPGTNVPPYDTAALRRYVVTNTTTSKEIEDYITEAELVEGGWIQLLYHRASEDAPLDSFVTPVSFAATLDVLQARGADVRPVGEVLGVWTPAPIVAETPEVVEGGKTFAQPQVFAPHAQLSPPDAGGCQAAPNAPAPVALLLLLLVPAGLSLGCRGPARGVRPATAV